MTREDIKDACVALTHLIEDSIDHPYGPPMDSAAFAITGKACTKLCDGDKDKARTLWKLIVSDHNGYMPLAAAHALIRAASTRNLVPDVEAPDPTAGDGS